MTTKFDAKKVKIDLSLLNESQRFVQQIKQIEPILLSLYNSGLSKSTLCNIQKILQGKKISMLCR
ncbi:MAG: hypothetical protein D3907_13035 [Candidatus Electrothrix sp. AUS3]|nr:hypothetical protein [Candidatus Electrothrix gigas]